MKRRLLVTFLCLCLIMQSAMIPVKTVVAEETGTQGETDSLEWIKTALPEGTYEYSDTSGTKTLKIIGEAQEVQLLAPLSIPDTLTLDLNGHTLKAAEKNNAVEMNFEDNNEEDAENFKTLTIISTSGQGTIIGASYQDWNSVYCNKCNIIVSQNVTLKGGQTGYGLYSSKGNVTVKSGARIEGGGYGTSNAGLGLYKNYGDITIESGSSVIGGSGNDEKNGGTGIFITKGNKITVDGSVTGGNGKAGGVGICVNGSVDNPIDIIINKSGKVTGGNGISDNGEGGKGVYFPYGGNITVSGTVSGGTGNLQKSDSGVGIYCDYISDISVESNIIIKSGGTVTGGDGNKESENGSDGIYITGGSVMVEEGAEVKGGGATNLYGTGGNALTANRTTASQVTATIAGTVIGGDGTKKGGYGAYGQNKNCTITISGNAMGGKAGDEYEGGTGGTGVCFHTVTVEDGGSVIGGDSDSNRGTGGCGVYAGASVIVKKEGRVIGGNANKTNGTGGDGIYSTSGSVEVSGTAIGGEASGSQGKGGVGVYSESGKITVSGKATGGSATGTDGTGGHGAYCKYPESKITGTSEGGRGHSKNGLDVCYIYPVTVGGVKVTSENQNNITGESFEGSASYDPDSNILSLKDGTNPNSINVKLDRVILELNGTNNISNISANNLTLKGTLDEDGNVDLTKVTGTISYGDPKPIINGTLILPSETTIDADYLNQLKGEGDIQVGDKTYSLKNYPVTVTDGTATPIIPSTPEPTATPKPTDTPEPNSESESTSESETNSASDAFPSEAPKVEIKDEVVETLSEILKDENLKKEDLKVEVSNVEPDKAKDEIAKLIEENESLKNLLESLNIGNKKDKNSDTSNKSDKNIEDSSKSDDKKGTDKDASKQDEKKGTDKTEDKSGDKEGTDKTEDKSGDKKGTDKTEDKSGDKKGTDKTEDKSDDKKGTDKNVSEADDKESTDKTSKLEEALDSLNILGAIKIHFFAGNKTINHFGNASITISIPVISTKSLPKNPLVIAISDDGRVSYMKGKIKGNQVQVKTNHVTTFIVTDLDYNEHIEAIKKVEFISPTTVIPLGKKVSFTLDVSGYNTKNITWVTTKKNRAVVKKNKGKLTALIKGKTVGKDTIRIKVKGKVVAEIKVTVAKRKTKTK